jgi:hypothetical protein
VDGRQRENEPPAGAIRNVILRNIIARGKGTSFINGHPDSWLENVSLENIKLAISTDPEAPYDKSVHAMKIRWAKNLRLKDIEISWEKPELKTWESALHLEDVRGLEISGFAGRQAHPGAAAAAITLNQVEDALIRNSKALPGTSTFLRVAGHKSRGISLFGNDLSNAKTPYRLEPEVKDQMQTMSNFLPARAGEKPVGGR